MLLVVVAKVVLYTLDGEVRAECVIEGRWRAAWSGVDSEVVLHTICGSLVDEDSKDGLSALATVAL